MATTSTDTNVSQLVINKMTKAEYEALPTKSDTELYLIPESVDSSPTQNSTNPVQSGGVYTALAGKQATLASQTAYTSKGSATKVPQITTNALGQVTGITEVTITQPDVSNFIEKSNTAGLVKNDGTIDTSTYLTSHQDITGKEDKMAIDSTAKTASFTASVGNYYTVNIAASGSVTITLTTPTDNTHISNAVFLVATSTSPALTFAAASGVDIYVSSSDSIEASKIYEINALWNGTNWSIAAVELEAQS